MADDRGEDVLVGVPRAAGSQEIEVSSATAERPAMFHVKRPSSSKEAPTRDGGWSDAGPWLRRVLEYCGQSRDSRSAGPGSQGVEARSRDPGATKTPGGVSRACLAGLLRQSLRVLIGRRGGPGFSNMLAAARDRAPVHWTLHAGIAPPWCIATRAPISIGSTWLGACIPEARRRTSRRWLSRRVGITGRDRSHGGCRRRRTKRVSNVSRLGRRGAPVGEETRRRPAARRTLAREGKAWRGVRRLDEQRAGRGKSRGRCYRFRQTGVHSGPVGLPAAPRIGLR